MGLNIEPFFDEHTANMTYVVWCDETHIGAIIDPVLDYELTSGQISTKSADTVLSFVHEKGLKIDWILETHIHADHLTAASYLKKELDAKIGIGEHIKQVIETWSPIFYPTQPVPESTMYFDHLFQNDEVFKIGNLSVHVLHTPGHTPACLTYHIKDAIFVGDTMFMPELGTARVDFSGGSAQQLYTSIQKLFKLPNETRVFVGHSYPKQGMEPTYMTTIAEQKSKNTMLNERTSFEEYKEKRTARDKTLGAPRLLFPSIEVNIRSGELATPKNNNVEYLRVPIDNIEQTESAPKKRGSA